MSNRLEHKATILSQDFGQAFTFLQLLDPEAGAFTFQIYGTQAKTLNASLDEAYGELIEANERGANIGVKVQRTDLKGGAAQNILAVRAIVQDDDDGYTKGYPLPFSIEIKTSPSRYQRLWLVKDVWPEEIWTCDDENGRQLFKAIQTTLVEYGNDRQFNDVTKCVRLPGFVNWNHDEPYLVTFEADGNPPRYESKELRKAFPPSYPTEKAIQIRGDAAVDWTLEKARLQSALKFVPADCSRDQWAKTVWGIQNLSGNSEDGRALVKQWSKTCPEKYDEHAMERVLGDYDEDRAEHPTVASIYREAIENGWDGGRKKDKEEVELTHNNLIKADWFGEGPITQEVRKRLKANFAGWGHDPAPQLWKALTHISTAMVEQARGKLGPYIYLSSVDPGGGKTETVIETLKLLLETDPAYSVILCLSTYDEIQRIAKRFNANDFACFTRDRETNKLGLGEENKDAARILLTTQAMVDAKLKKKNFGAEKEFYYKGKPRIGKIWDESILLGNMLVLDTNKIAAMLALTQDEFPDWTEQARNLFVAITQATEDQTIEVPNLYEFAHEYEIRAIFEEVDYGDKITSDDASMLFQFSERTVNVVRDNTRKTKIICFVKNIPDDIWPVIVLDASSSFRKTYQFMNDADKIIRQLETFRKNYENATFHVCPKGGGKTTINRASQKYIDGVARQVNRTAEKVLVIHHKNLNVDFRTEVDRQVTGDKTRVGYLTYGKHKGTNEFSDRSEVILAGTSFHDTATKHLLVRLP